MTKLKSKLLALISEFGFWLIDLLRGINSLALYNQLKREQFLPAAELAKIQQQRLMTYVQQASASVPFYSGKKAYLEFPVINKEVINANKQQFFSSAYKGKLFQKKTGGSTGEPFVYFTGVESQSYLWAGILLAWDAAGYRLGDKVAFVAGSSIFNSGFKQKVYYGLMNVTLMSAFNLTAERADQYIAALVSKRVRFVYGYASAIHQIALRVLQGNARPAFSLRAIICTAEMLTDAMRADIGKAFGCPVFNQYGCNDAGVSAFECEQHQGFHLISSRAYIEVDAAGRLLATDLANDAFMVARYDTGDLVQMAEKPCACGRGLPVISRVVGRSNDMVVDASGKSTHSEFFTHLFREDSSIRAFQVLFNRKQLIVNIHSDVSDASAYQHYLKTISANLDFGRYELVLNGEFEFMANRKRKFVMRVADDYQPAPVVYALQGSSMATAA